jgi:hypothetical protein
MIIEVGLDFSKTLAKSLEHVPIEWHPLPMSTFASGENATVNEVDVLPSASHDLCAPQTRPLHQQDRW